jgi:hypothetical protein
MKVATWKGIWRENEADFMETGTKQTLFWDGFASGGGMTAHVDIIGEHVERNEPLGCTHTGF